MVNPVDMAGRVRGVGISPLRAAAHVLDESARSLRAAVDHKLPVLFNRTAVFEERGARALTAVRQAEQAVTLLQEAGPRGETLAKTMQFDVEYLHRVFDGRPFAEARHSLTRGHLEGMFGIRADRARMLDDLAHLDDAAARDVLERRLEAPVRRMLAHDDAARREVALIAGAPEAVRPRQLVARISPGVWDSVGASRPDAASMAGSAAYEDVAAAARRFELGRMAPAELDAHVASLLRREPDTLTLAEVRELAIAATLPEHVPAALDATSLRHPERLMSLIAAQETLVDGRPARMASDSFLREIEALQLVRDGAAPTRQQATDELAKILDTPLDALTPQQERRMSVLMHLPAERRPLLPTAPETFQFRRLGLRTGWSITPEQRAVMLERARTHFHDLRDPTAALAELRRAIVDEQPFDVHRMAVLLADRSAVQAAGIDDAMVARAITRQLQRAGTSDVKGAPLEQLLQSSRERLASSTLRPELEQVRADTLELLDRNLDRMTGARLDTFGRHPDYAEVGRVAAQLQLLESVQRGPASTTAAAKGAGEILTW